MQKNEIVSLDITDITADGSGVGRVNGMAVFVPLSAPGDRLSVRILKVKKTYAYGKIEQILSPSPDRVAADCPVFRQCGGCALRHMEYEAELKLKAARVREAMRRIGGVEQPPLPMAAGSSMRYRNKAQYPFSRDGHLGFFAVHSHRTVPCADCLLQPEIFARVAQTVQQWGLKNGLTYYDETTGKGLLRHLFLRRAAVTGALMVVLVINGTDLPCADRLIADLRAMAGDALQSLQININTADTNVVLGPTCRCLYGSESITDILCGVRVRLSPLSFYQVNHDMAERLYKKAAEFANPQGKTVLDLYCGTGTIGLSMAGSAKQIIGVEIVPAAVADAKENAAQNGIGNARFLCADAADAAKQLSQEGLHPDVVIVDPPRKGCAPELLRTIAEDFAPARVVYVSCDPATLARDVALLRPLGYMVEQYAPFDLFARTCHVETVVLLSKK